MKQGRDENLYIEHSCTQEILRLIYFQLNYIDRKITFFKKKAWQQHNKQQMYNSPIPVTKYLPSCEMCIPFMAPESEPSSSRMVEPSYTSQ